MDSTEDGRAQRVGPFLLPALMAGGALAASFVILGDLFGSSEKYAPLDPAAFSDIAFVANVDQPVVVALQTALTEACDRTGCDADVLHPMILASADNMSSDELSHVLDAQVRIQAESAAARDRAQPGSDDARMAELEILAAEQIGAFFELARAQR